jgi:plastocyanin
MKKRSTLILLLLFLFIVGAIVAGYFAKNSISLNKSEIKKSQKENVASKDLIKISPQKVTDSVFIDSATISKNGFVVVREVNDSKVSQVIEMSRPLKVGLNKDIKINLGNADVKNKELVVMLYEDYGNDGIFNDLDMPLLDSEGITTANFISTGEKVPSEMTEAEMEGMNMPGMKAMVKVRYTNKGFSPDKINIKVGDMVEFVNESDTQMWAASMPHPQHSKLPTFDQFKAYKKGAIYRYVFDKKGTWEYHDHLNPSAGGVVNVE